ncbi:MAG: peptidase S8, partial [Bacteroidia bacterium]|nr:peptidase S8 [Bacteroidia bacterium]
MVGPAHGASFYFFRTENGFSETIAEEYHWVAAAEEADRLGADVCQTSLGYLTFDGGVGDHSYPDLDGNTTVITLAADLAASRGMVVVNSAGNEGNNAWGYIIAPADGDSV